MKFYMSEFKEKLFFVKFEISYYIKKNHTTDFSLVQMHFFFINRTEIVWVLLLLTKLCFSLAE